MQHSKGFAGLLGEGGGSVVSAKPSSTAPQKSPPGQQPPLSSTSLPPAAAGSNSTDWEAKAQEFLQLAQQEDSELARRASLAAAIERKVPGARRAILAVKYVPGDDAASMGSGELVKAEVKDRVLRGRAVKR